MTTHKFTTRLNREKTKRFHSPQKQSITEASTKKYLMTYQKHSKIKFYTMFIKTNQNQK